MANKSRKRAPALFEVIGERGGPAERRPIFRFPKLSLGRTATTAPGFAVVDAAPAMADLAPVPRVEMPDIRPSLADPTIGRGGSMMSSSSSGVGSSRRRRSSGMHFGYDADRQEVTLRMRYTTAVVGAFSVLVLIGLAYVTGRQGSRAPAALAAVSTEALKKGPAQPGVLDVGRAGDDNRTAMASMGGGPATVTALKQPAGAKPGAATQQQRPLQPNGSRPLVQPTSSIVEDNARRAINLNYVIIQSYPDRKSADEAAGFLNKAGIRCTVEPAPAGFVNNPSWVSVIGTKGFNKIRNSQEFDTYVQSIEKAGAQFAGNSKFKRFQPQPYKWRQGA